MPNGLEQRLWADVAQQVSEHSLGIATNCEDMLRSLIRQGVERMEAEGAASDESHIRAAEASLATYVAVMVKEAVAAGYSELHEGTFAAAHRGVCPIWPFC